MNALHWNNGLDSRSHFESNNTTFITAAGWQEGLWGTSLRYDCSVKNKPQWSLLPLVSDLLCRRSEASSQNMAETKTYRHLQKLKCVTCQQRDTNPDWCTNRNVKTARGSSATLNSAQCLIKHKFSGVCFSTEKTMVLQQVAELVHITSNWTSLKDNWIIHIFLNCNLRYNDDWSLTVRKMASIASCSAWTTWGFFSLNFSRMVGTTCGHKERCLPWSISSFECGTVQLASVRGLGFGS